MWNQRCLKIITNNSVLKGFCQRFIKDKYTSRLNQSRAQTGCVSNPPWRVLFFGSDDFAVESLKRLSVSRGGGAGSVVDLLEVVTLPKSVPVRRFAERHEVRVHEWPNVDVSGRFDVGVVVSFGCLLQENLINKLPYGILNVHPSLLPRWRGPAPIFHTILHGDKLTGVTVMQIRPKRFDVGPILSQELYEVPEHCTADELGSTLGVLGAQLLIDTLRKLPERIASRREQATEGATFAPKISSSLSWLVWEEQTCDQIRQLYRAIGTRVPLRTSWMGQTVKLLDFVGKCNVPFTEKSHPRSVPGSVYYQKESGTLLICCKDGWVGFRTLMLKKRLSAADFYNGYLHQRVRDNCCFQSYRERSVHHHTVQTLNVTCERR